MRRRFDFQKICLVVLRDSHAGTIKQVWRSHRGVVGLQTQVSETGQLSLMDQEEQLEHYFRTLEQTWHPVIPSISDLRRRSQGGELNYLARIVPFQDAVRQNPSLSRYGWASDDLDAKAGITL
jgi:hypothetical protein